MRKIIILSIVVLFSCGKQKVKEIKTDYFYFYTPNEWTLIDFKGIDSYVSSGLITKKGDTIYIDYGLYSSSFKETIKVFSGKQIQKYDSLKMDTKYLKSSESPEVDTNQAVFHKEFYYYEKIDKNSGKVRIPKKEGTGITGISFRNVNGSENHLTISARNLNLEEQNELLKSFKTIKFK